MPGSSGRLPPRALKPAEPVQVQFLPYVHQDAERVQRQLDAVGGG